MDEYIESFPKIMYYMDEPLADPSAIALYFVSEIASKEVKVVLSGEGADEFLQVITLTKRNLLCKDI